MPAENSTIPPINSLYMKHESGVIDQLWQTLLNILLELHSTSIYEQGPSPPR